MTIFFSASCRRIHRRLGEALEVVGGHGEGCRPSRLDRGEGPLLYLRQLPKAGPGRGDLDDD